MVIKIDPSGSGRSHDDLITLHLVSKQKGDTTVHFRNANDSWSQ